MLGRIRKGVRRGEAGDPDQGSRHYESRQNAAVPSAAAARPSAGGCAKAHHLAGGSHKLGFARKMLTTGE